MVILMTFLWKQIIKKIIIHPRRGMTVLLFLKNVQNQHFIYSCVELSVSSCQLMMKNQ